MPWTHALYGADSAVLQLTASDFKSQVVDSDDVVLVEFYAPWCGHCKNLAPEWEKAAKALTGVATVAAIDCDAHPSLAQEFDVKGFPTIKVFGGNKKAPSDYQGPREAKGIVDYAISQVKQLVHQRLGGKFSSAGGGKKKGGGGGGNEGPSAVIELTQENFSELVLDSPDLWMVEFFAPWCGHCKNLEPEWKRAANSLKGQVKFGAVDCTTQTDLAQQFEIKGFPTILVFGADKALPTPYEGSRTAAAIESFAAEALEEAAVAPEVKELTGQDVMDEYCAKSTICFATFLPDILDTGAAGRNRYLEMLRSVAEKFKKKSFSYVWAQAGSQPALEKAVGVGGYGYPALVALSVKKKVYAPFKAAFEEPHLREFVAAATQGGRGIQEMESVPAVKAVEPWDGLDGQLPEEEEFSLDDLMGDDGATNKEEL